MKFFEWTLGRQGTGYEKMPLFISKQLKCDFYLLKFPAGTVVPTHTDPVDKEYDHYRINYTVIGSNCVGQRMYVLGKHRRFWRIIFFRPDKYEHGLQKQKRDAYMFSFGWLKKKTN
jgi:hypothetical protein